ncbi:hypothetical protein [Nostoc sp. TCL26-01]|uniref:hypothetical protein n=1 Tax=Nostoc sp. TCL26-01 TaxID=2576904 RepID=UPI0015C07D3E|nr:hypothetical protein [Nostoc sp. TCL26-01]
MKKNLPVFIGSIKVFLEPNQLDAPLEDRLDQILDQSNVLRNQVLKNLAAC